MSQASWSSADLPVVLDQPHLGDDPGEVGVAALVGGDQPVDGVGDAAVHAGLAAAGQVGARARRCGAPRGRGSRRSPSATGGGRPTARRTAGRGRTRRCRARSAAGRRGRTRRPRSPAPRRWSGCRRSRCGRCRGGSGSRCRRTRTLNVPAGSTSRSPGNASASFARGAAAAHGVIGCGGQVELAVAPALAHEGGVGRRAPPGRATRCAARPRQASVSEVWSLTARSLRRPRARGSEGERTRSIGSGHGRGPPRQLSPSRSW